MKIALFIALQKLSTDQSQESVRRDVKMTFVRSRLNHMTSHVLILCITLASGDPSCLCRLLRQRSLLLDVL